MSTDVRVLAGRLLALPDLTTLLADALEGRPDAGSVVPVPLLPRTSARRLCGPAVALRLRPAGPDERLSHDPMLARTTPGAVAVIDGGTHVGGAVLGGRLARLGLAHGLTGYVVHGAVRDVEDLDGLGLPVWSTLTHAAGARTTLAPDPDASTVTLGGVRIVDGDLLAADGNGVVVVHAAAVAEVCVRAEVIAAAEAEESASAVPGRGATT